MLLSGGIDSATCLYLANKKYRTRALTFEYHGIASREIEAARAVANSASISEHRFVRLPDLKEASEIAEVMFEKMPPTYVPMRNSVFYSFAASYAEEVRADFIIGGHNRDDMRTFLDARPAFFVSLERAFWSGSLILRKRKTRVLLPVGGKTKVQVIKLGESLGVPLELTWSCHREGMEHCWGCEGCLLRLASFDAAGVPDPLRKPVRVGKV